MVYTVDPELKAEFEERQKGGGVGATAGVNSLQNFDAAAWLAGTSTKEVKKSEPQGKITRWRSLDLEMHAMHIRAQWPRG